MCGDIFLVAWASHALSRYTRMSMRFNVGSGSGRGCPATSIYMFSEFVNLPLRETQIAFFGGRGTKVQRERGECSQGRPARRGTRSAQARFWERGRSGRRPQRSLDLVLDGAGDSPQYCSLKSGTASPPWGDTALAEDAWISS